MSTNDDRVLQAMSEIGARFRTFGGGLVKSANNPVARALKDSRLQFAAGVDVEEVVRTVLRIADEKVHSR